ncbi:UNVERIFIED_CONTAM: hypothetical protein PYX00_005341 [Menopon gallinae]|uniref:N-acetyltransferase ESCO2 n=1 Tax=Menopon gallinae TaxID=328185 RepID=A0AAW2HS86_9NEOP
MSNCSIEQDENIVRKFRKTPGTPTKTIHMTPRRSSRKRSLFQPSSPVSSPAKSDDLGPMSPLSSSSNDSYMLSNDSPCFSPNGKFSTPPKTPERTSYSRKLELSSSVFPSLKLQTPKSHKSPCTPRRSLRLTPKKSGSNSVTAEDILRDLTTPPKSSRKSRKAVVDSDDDTSQNCCDSTPRRRMRTVEASPVSKLGIKTISCESFYGPSQPTFKPKTQLIIDTLGSKLDNKLKNRSLSLESITSNRSFVSGGRPSKKRSSDTFSRPRGSKRGRQKGPHVGVWHGVKKPKKMKFDNKMKKPVISPKSRVAKMIESGTGKPIQVKPKRLFEEKPRRRVAAWKKKNADFSEEDNIIDSFPHNLIKRKKLPTAVHPANEVEIRAETSVPDPNKKFLKYGIKRKATFTLSENLKLQFSDGVMKLQSPKKRRKLYSGKNEVIFDFCDDDEKNNQVKENIENILNKLEDDKDISNDESKGGVQVKKITEDQLVNILNSPGTKISLVNGTPSKVLTEIQNDSGSRLLANMSSLAINELREENVSVNESLSGSKTEFGLEKTGNILATARNVLTNTDLTVDTYPLSEEEATTPKNMEEKFYSLFYKQNWNTSIPSKEANGKTSAKKKSIKVPDDQYLLDAGQKSIGIVTCNKCGVMYQAGDFADEATHKNFHDHLPELRFTGWTNERVVGRYLDGRVIMIVNSDPKVWWHKVTKIVDIVDQELGFPEGSVNALFYKTVYLFISDKAKQIVGCLIAEECKEAFKMFPPLEGVDVDSCSKDPSPCKVGISRIWTALNHRRCGVAKRMIDCMRRTFIFGEIVPMDLVAFSVPSPSGKLLAQNVTGKLDFLVYGFV